MEQIINYIGANWTDWLFLTVTGTAAWGCRVLAKRQKDEACRYFCGTESLKPITTTTIRAIARFTPRKVCAAFMAYHALGGNDVATELKEKLLEMPAEMKWEAEMRSTRPPVI